MLTGIFEVDTGNYQKLIEHQAKAGGNLLVFGQAGIGKTEIPFQVARRLNMPTVYWNLSTQEAPDLVGLPIIKEVDGCEVVKYAAPEYMPVKERVKEPVMVVVDELDKAKPDIQNPLLEVLHSRTINGRPLNIGCVVATGNLPDENAFSKPISSALANRCQIYRLKSTFEEWQAWASADTRLQSGPGGALIVGFLSRNQEYLSQPPVQGDPTAYTRASPRSWTYAAYDLNSAPPGADVEYQTIVIAGRVGTDPAAKFRVWLDHYRHIEPLADAIIKSGKLPELNNLTVDRILVLALATCSAIVQTSNKPVKTQADKDKLKKEVQQVTKNVFGYLAQISPEFQIASVKSVLTVELIQNYQLTTIPDVMRVYGNVRQAMRTP